MDAPDSATTRLCEYIPCMLPWAHGHQRKALSDFVRALIAPQTGCQAQLARSFGNQEAAVKRLSRLLHNERLEPRHLADAVRVRALVQLPLHGPVRLAIDWTIEGQQHVLVVSLGVGRQAVPIYWRAYAATVLKGRMQRYELAVIRRALRHVICKVGPRHGRVTADRGCADVALFALLTELRVACVIRVKKNTKVCIAGGWYKLSTLRCRASAVRCEEPAVAVGDHESPAGCAGQVGALVCGHQSALYGGARRAGCEAGFRDAQWWRGFARARIKQISAWSRLFALVAMALLGVVSLARRLLLRQGAPASTLLRQVASRRRGRCEWSLASAMISLLHQDPGLYEHLVPRLKLKIEGDLANVS